MVDTAAMLLSTDWFLPFWPLIGIEVGSQRCLQEGCRKIVLRFMDGAANYYLINFSHERTDSTRQSMQALAAQCGLNGTAKESLEKLVAHMPEREQFYKTAWLFCSFIEQISKDPATDDAVRFIIKRSRREFSFARECDFNTACLESKSPWDVYTRGLTPELPDNLSNVMSASLLPGAELTRILQQITPAQSEGLLQKFRSLAKSLYDVEVENRWPAAP